MFTPSGVTESLVNRVHLVLKELIDTSTTVNIPYQFIRSINANLLGFNTFSSTQYLALASTLTVLNNSNKNCSLSVIIFATHVVLVLVTLPKSPRLHRFKSDPDEMSE